MCDNRGLSRSLRWPDSLRVRVQCHACGRMPKQFLHDLYVCSTCLQQRRIRMLKGMPAESFGDAHFYHSRPDVNVARRPVPRMGTSPGGTDRRKPSPSVDGNGQCDAKHEESEPNVDQVEPAFAMLLFCTGRLIVPSRATQSSGEAICRPCGVIIPASCQASR